MDPCGCPGSPSGGLGRRISLMRAQKTRLSSPLFLEGPDFLAMPSELTRYGEEGVEKRGTALLRLLKAEGLSAFLPGIKDLEMLGWEGLLRMGRAAGLPVVATNLRDFAGKSPFPGHLILESGGHKVAILGVLSRTSLSSHRSRQGSLLDPVQAVKEELKKVTGVEAVVAVTDIPPRELPLIASQLQQVDFWLGEARRGEARRGRVGGTRLFRCDGGGTEVGRLDLVFTGPNGARFSRGAPAEDDVETRMGYEDQVILASFGRPPQEPSPAPPPPPSVGNLPVPAASPTLTDRIAQVSQRLFRNSNPAHLAGFRTLVMVPEIPEDPATAGVLDVIRGELLEGAASRVESSRQLLPLDQVYRGVDVCLSCHPAQFAQWSGTGHATGFESLVQRERTEDPACLPCHTTGWGAKEGFTRPEEGRHLLGIQCESCHGPARAEHPRVPGGFRDIDEARCVNCHDAQNDPDFNFAASLPLIRHRLSP